MTTVTYTSQAPTAPQSEVTRDALASMIGSYVATAERTLTMPSEVAALAELDPDFPVADYEEALAKLRAVHAALRSR